ncbi:MAG: porphobilinogen synthase [Planctomycetales bacterium]|nr:porphobilinogen synthase [Planctomycetales bacterium]
MKYPATRLRRLRRTPALRRLFRETRLAPEMLVQPLFVKEGLDRPVEIASMPGQRQHSLRSVVEAAAKAREAGVGGAILFGVPARKDPRGDGAADPAGVVPAALRALKAAVPDLVLIADVCLCEYTTHGHCGIVVGEGPHAEIANDETLPQLARAAVAYAEAGADLVAPSDMMDGRVGAIRAALDAAGRKETPILSYAAKYASAFYGPFRDAAESPPSFGDRKSHQMDPANADEALREVAQDLEEGADAVMVKPAGPNLDVIRRVKDRFQVPVAAYQVSGEYAAVKAAAARGWLDERTAALELLTAIARAGADVVLTYWATEAAGWL